MICDRQTDRQTDTRGKTICLPTLKGGDITIAKFFVQSIFESLNTSEILNFKNSNLKPCSLHTKYLGDNCFQNLHLGRFIIGYTFGIFVQ